MRVTKWSMVDGDGNHIMDLEDGMTIDKSVVGHENRFINIVADTYPPTVGSMKMQVSGDMTNSRTDGKYGWTCASLWLVA